MPARTSDGRRRALALVMGLVGCAAQPAEVPAPEPPRGVCSASVESIDFGEVDLSSGGGPLTFGKTFRVTNHSGRALNLVTAPLPLPFILSSSMPARISPGQFAEFVVFFHPNDALLHFTEFTATGDGCEVRVPVRGLGSGTLMVSPTSLDFGVVEPGEEKTLEFQLENTRRTPVQVLSVLLTQGGGPAVFRLSGPAGMVVPARSSASVRVTAAPLFAEVFSARLLLSTEVDLMDLGLELSAGSPAAELLPEVLDVPLVGLHGWAERTIRVRNVGSSGQSKSAALRLQPPFISIEALEGSPRELEVYPPNALFEGLAGWASSELVVRLAPVTLGPKRFRLTLFTNERKHPEHTVMLESLAVALPPCVMRVEPQPELRLLPDDERGTSGSITFENLGSSTCILDDLRLTEGTNPEWAITSGSGLQVSVPAGRSHTVTIKGPRIRVSSRLGALTFRTLQSTSRAQLIDLYAVP